MPVVWNSITHVHLLKILMHPKVIAFFGTESQYSHICSKFKPVFSFFLIFNFHYQDRKNETGQKIDSRKGGTVVFWSWLIFDHSGILPVVKLLVAGNLPWREYLYHGNERSLHIQAFLFSES